MSIRAIERNILRNEFGNSRAMSTAFRRLQWRRNDRSYPKPPEKKRINFKKILRKIAKLSKLINEKGSK